MENEVQSEFNNEDLNYMYEDEAQEAQEKQTSEEVEQEASTSNNEALLLAEIKALREDNAKQLKAFNEYINPIKPDEALEARKEELKKLGLEEVSKINDLEAMQTKGFEEIEALKLELQRQAIWQSLEQEVSKRYPSLDFKELKDTANILRGVESGDPKAWLKLASLMSPRQTNLASTFTKSSNLKEPKKEEGDLSNDDYALRVLELLDGKGV